MNDWMVLKEVWHNGYRAFYMQCFRCNVSTIPAYQVATTLEEANVHVRVCPGHTMDNNEAA